MNSAFVKPVYRWGFTKDIIEEASRFRRHYGVEQPGQSQPGWPTISTPIAARVSYIIPSTREVAHSRDTNFSAGYVELFGKSSDTVVRIVRRRNFKTPFFDFVWCENGLGKSFRRTRGVHSRYKTVRAMPAAVLPHVYLWEQTCTNLSIRIPA